MSIRVALIYTNVVLFGIGGTFHAIGLIVLSKVRVGATYENQKLILQNLAVVELLLSISMLVARIVQLNVLYEGTVKLIMYTVTGFPYLALPSLLMYMLLDRIFAVYFHVRYLVIFTRKLVKIILTTIWILAATITLLATLSAEIYSSVNQVTRRLEIYNLTGDLLIFMFFVVHFSYLAYKVKQIKDRDRKLCILKTVKKKSSYGNKHLTPMLMILTYVMFKMSGQVILTITEIQKRGIEFRQIGALLNSINIITDGFIYIFLQKNYRRYLRGRLLCLNIDKKVLFDTGKFQANETNFTDHGQFVSNRLTSTV